MRRAKDIIRNARVHTLDSEAPWAEAVAIEGDRISHVGSSAGLEAHIMKLSVAVVTLFLAVGVQGSECIVDMNGTWELKPEKSLDERGPDSESLVFKNSDVEQRYSMEYVNEDGEKRRLDWAVKCDGQDHPSPPAPWTDAPGRTVSLTRLGAKSELVTHKQDGVVTGTYTRVLVDDDKTLISIGRDGDGNVEWVRVFEKQ